MNLPSIASNITSTNITYNSFAYNDISSSESDDDETITSIDSTNESIHLIDEESSSDESSH